MSNVTVTQEDRNAYDDMMSDDLYDHPPHAVWYFARHRTTALAAKEAELAAARAKVEKLREALHDAICMIGHAMPMDTTVLAGQRLVAREVWQTGYNLLHPKPKKEIA